MASLKPNSCSKPRSGSAVAAAFAAVVVAAAFALVGGRTAAAAENPSTVTFKPAFHYSVPGVFEAKVEPALWPAMPFPQSFPWDGPETANPDPPADGLDWLQPLDGGLAAEPDRAFFRYPDAWASDTQCLVGLLQEGVRFELLAPVPGIGTPVRLLQDHLGGVLYRDYFRRKRPLPMDCRLAMSLVRAGAVLRRLGVTEVIWSSTYRPVLPDPEKVPEEGYNMHNQGLAIDIRGFRFGTRRVTVAEHYERGLGTEQDESCVGNPVTRNGLLLRMLSCDLDSSDLFSVILTPDYDAGHWNHFHMSVFHPKDRWRRRHKRTVLLEVDLNALPGWALGRPKRSEPELRRWEETAAQAWPKQYEWLHEQLQEDVARFLARRKPEAPPPEEPEDWLEKGFRWMVPAPHRALFGKALSSLADTLEKVY